MTAVELERSAILVDAVAEWSGRHGGDTPPRRDVGPLVVPVGDLGKSVEFYRRVFGFRPRSTWRGPSFGPLTPGSLRLAARGRAELWLRPRCTAPDEAAQNRRWAFVVTNLEEVREKVWDLGVKVARDSGEPDHIFRRGGRASLYVRDPDGNEIELVEMNCGEQPRRALPQLVGAIRGRGLQADANDVRASRAGPQL